MSTEENKAMILRHYEELNKGNLDIVDELYATDFVGYITGLPEPVRGREAQKSLVAAFFTAFPDLHETAEELIAEGDKVVIRESYRGTHKGNFMGIPPTGRKVTMELIDFVRVRDRKIVEHWNIVDQLGLMQQLGVLP